MRQLELIKGCKCGIEEEEKTEKGSPSPKQKSCWETKY
jgi:hypothetical protein